MVTLALPPTLILTTWSIPREATTPRGWFLLKVKNTLLEDQTRSQASPEGNLTVAFYLQYPDGSVLARAYLDLRPLGGTRFSVDRDQTFKNTNDAQWWIVCTINDWLKELGHSMIGDPS